MPTPNLKLPFSNRVLHTNLRVVALISALALLCFMAIWFYLGQQQLRNTVGTQASVLASDLAESLQRNDPEQWQTLTQRSAQIIDAASNSGSTMSITIYNDKGAPGVAWTPTGFQQAPANPSASGAVSTPPSLPNPNTLPIAKTELQFTQLRVANPIVTDKFAGTVVLLVSLAPLYRALMWQLLIGAILGAAFTWRAALYLTEQQLRHIAPVFEFAKIVKQAVTNKDYSLRLSYDIKHELGSLGRHFNQLLMDVEVSEASRLADEQQRDDEERRLNILSNHDSLTKLPNRHYFHRLISDSMEQAASSKTLCALAFIDIDHLKRLNEQFGYEAGDLIVATITHRLSTVLRSTDTLCRVDGDEFAAILPDVDTPERAAQLAERLTQVVRQPMTLRGKKLIVTASVGVACYPLHGKEQRLFLHYTDLALRAAKTAGGNSSRLFHSNMNVYTFNAIAKSTEG